MTTRDRIDRMTQAEIRDEIQKLVELGQQGQLTPELVDKLYLLRLAAGRIQSAARIRPWVFTR